MQGPPLSHTPTPETTECGLASLAVLACASKVIFVFGSRNSGKMLQGTFFCFVLCRRQIELAQQNSLHVDANNYESMAHVSL